MGQGGERPLIHDTGCGTSVSSVPLTLRYPQSFVIEVDLTSACLATGVLPLLWGG